MAQMRIEASLRASEGEVPLALRVGWLAVVVGATLLGLFSLPAYYHSLLTACSGAVCNLDGSVTAADVQALGAAGVTPQAYATYTVALYCLILPVWLLVALLIFLQRPNDPGALLIALILATANVFAVNGPVTALVFATPILTVPVNILMILGDVGYTLLFLIFPDGRFVPRWTRWAALVTAVVSALTNLTPPNSPFNAPDSPLAAALSIAVLPMVVLALWAQIDRYRRVSTQRQREQSKWAVFGLILAGIGLLALNIAGVVAQEALGGSRPSEVIVNTLYPLVLLTIPVSIGIAILRHRLYDIDIIINRTLVYGSLTAILAALYFALVVGAQSLIHLATGQQGQSSLVIVLSTLLIAALFQPLRRWLQQWIDRRFYRSRYDAAKTVAAFSASLRSEVDLSQLYEQLLAVVEETMRPAQVSLWLREAPHSQQAPPADRAGR